MRRYESLSVQDLDDGIPSPEVTWKPRSDNRLLPYRRLPLTFADDGVLLLFPDYIAGTTDDRGLDNGARRRAESTNLLLSRLLLVKGW